MKNNKIVYSLNERDVQTVALEIIDRGIQDNLNNIQYMTDKLDQWK